MPTPIILFTGKVSRRKGVLNLLAAHRLLKQPHQLILVGDGELRPAIMKDNIVVTGFINYREIPRFYWRSDIFVLPSLYEPWGLSVNEACAAGLPVVVSDACGCAQDLVNGNGFIFPAGNVKALAECLDTLLASSTLRKRMGARSKEIVAEFSYEKDIEGIMEALQHG
jgi:glycosyltransferase involved in cell wall biosynthesis